MRKTNYKFEKRQKDLDKLRKKEEKLKKKQERKGVGESTEAGDPVEVDTALVTLETVRLGKAVAHNVQAAVYDIAAVDPIDGLLGLSFLDQFRFTIDSKASVMHLEPRR